MFRLCHYPAGSALLGLVILLAVGCGEQKEGLPPAAKPGQTSDPATPVEPAINPAGPGKDEKACFTCNGAGTVPCSARGCVAGKVECPGPCLKLTRGSWVHMNVPGHDPKELWQKFRKPNGGVTAWNQGHVGEVIALQNGDYVNIGKCTVCSGTTRVACSACKGLGRQPCELCGGKKYVPIAWTPTNNPWLDKQPDVIRLKDGRVLLGKIVLSSGDDRTIKLRDGKTTHVNANEIAVP